MDTDLAFISSPVKNLESQKTGEQAISTPQSHLAEMGE